VTLLNGGLRAVLVRAWPGPGRLDWCYKRAV
jgi:hypothetical protein